MASARKEGDGVEFVHANLLDEGVAARVVQRIDIVFHLAAKHGGRGYVDLHQAAFVSAKEILDDTHS